MGEIVVGFDGSEGSVRALEWALDEADAHQDSVRVVSAFAVAGSASTDFARAAVPELYHGGQPTDEAVDNVKRAAQQAFEEVLAKASVPTGVEVTFEAVPGEPPEVLISESDGARLLIVGSRGLGGFRSLMLGSVSHQVVQHARCPVLVIPRGR